MDDYLAYTQKDLDEAYIEDLQEDLEEQKKKIAENNRTIEENNKTIENLMKQIQSLTNTVNTLVEGITAFRTENEDLKTRLAKYESIG